MWDGVDAVGDFCVRLRIKDGGVVAGREDVGLSEARAAAQWVMDAVSECKRIEIWIQLAA